MLDFSVSRREQRISQKWYWSLKCPALPCTRPIHAINHLSSAAAKSSIPAYKIEWSLTFCPLSGIAVSLLVCPNYNETSRLVFSRIDCVSNIVIISSSTTLSTLSSPSPSPLSWSESVTGFEGEDRDGDGIYGGQHLGFATIAALGE